MRAHAREAWEAERRKGIGGSDVDDALSEPPYGCRRRLAYDKLETPPDYPDVNILLTRRGQELEEIIAQRYAEETGRKVVRRPSAAHPEIPWARVNVDREILGVEEIVIKAPAGDVTVRKPGVGALECKSHASHLFRAMVRDGLPTSHILQLQWAMFVRNRRWGSYVVLNPESWEVLIFDVLYDPELIQAILPKVEATWMLIEAGVLPEKLDAKDKRCSRCPWRKTCQGEELARFVPSEDRERLIERDESFAELLADRQEMKRVLEENERVLDAIEDCIREKFGDRTAIECEGFRAYYAPQKGRRSVDMDLLEKKYPDAFKACVKYGRPSRPLRVYPI
jgi:predicted phage-related endonuclease